MMHFLSSIPGVTNGEIRTEYGFWKLKEPDPLPSSIGGHRWVHLVSTYGVLLLRHLLRIGDAARTSRMGHGFHHQQVRRKGWANYLRLQFDFASRDLAHHDFLILILFTQAIIWLCKCDQSCKPHGLSVSPVLLVKHALLHDIQVISAYHDTNPGVDQILASFHRSLNAVSAIINR
jgi:hypothetical protein